MQPALVADQWNPVQEDAGITGLLPPMGLRKRVLFARYRAATVVLPKGEIQVGLNGFALGSLLRPLLLANRRDLLGLVPLSTLVGMQFPLLLQTLAIRPDGSRESIPPVQSTYGSRGSYGSFDD
jgi:hypothetical protein